MGKNRFSDPKAGLIGGLVIGLIVLWINAYHGLGLTFVAGLKQFIYTFFMGGLVAKVCENISVNVRPAIKAVLMAVLIPSVVIVFLTYLLYSLKGTPKPFLSTLPTIILTPIITIFWSLKKRKDLKIFSD
ncbi:MAG: hypothetical protein HRT57_06785 [Crocinitomicaceae bacterium]|nr:hypothetical protein [Crocinitomicaceae bacterium]